MAKESSKEREGELRKRAEIILSTKPEAFRALASADVQKLIHELNVHQVELEMQNAELRRVQLELQEARDKYLIYMISHQPGISLLTTIVSS